MLPGQACSCQTRWGTLCPQSQSRKALHNWDLAGKGLVRRQLPLPWVRRFRCFKPKQVYGARTWPKWPVSAPGCLFNLPGVRQRQQRSLWPSSLTLSLLLPHVPPWGFPHGLRAACWQNRERGSAFARSGRRGFGHAALPQHARPAAGSWCPCRSHPQPEPHIPQGSWESGFILCAFPANGRFKTSQTQTPDATLVHTPHQVAWPRQETGVQSYGPVLEI